MFAALLLSFFCLPLSLAQSALRKHDFARLRLETVSLQINSHCDALVAAVSQLCLLLCSLWFCCVELLC